MKSQDPIDLPAADRLSLLRRFDSYRRWTSLSDKRRCLQCNRVIAGHEIEIVGGTRALGPLRLQCPTEGCLAVVMDWVLLETETPPIWISPSADENVPAESLLTFERAAAGTPRRPLARDAAP
ncbi:MAG: hypothetical protein M3Z22_03635 [Verrucomicrobiota bacterium]|nr:hypothetical protein [Verrucomicrobiota bacterium]